MDGVFDYRLEDVGLNRRALLLKIEYTDWGSSGEWYREKIRLLSPEYTHYSIEELFELIQVLLPPDHIEILLHPEQMVFWPKELVRAARYSLVEYHRCLLLAIRLADRERRHESMLRRFAALADDAYTALVDCKIAFREEEDGVYVSFPYSLQSFLYKQQPTFWCPDERLALFYKKELSLVTQLEDLRSIKSQAQRIPPWIVTVQRYTPYLLAKTIALPAPKSNVS